MNLACLRDEIDAIDTEMVALICKRMDIAKAVAIYKAEQNIPILNAQREADVLSRIKKLGNSNYQGEVSQIFMHIMELSKKLQEKTQANP